MTPIILALGSNLGNRLHYLTLAVEKIKKHGNLIRASSVYESEPYGIKMQNTFYNAVIQIDTTLSPMDLLKFLLQIETEMGRVRSQKWGPRIIDLDIIFYGTQIIRKPDLEIPHPDYLNRNFVMIPLAEIIPDFVPPEQSESISVLARKFSGDPKIWRAPEQWTI